MRVALHLENVSSQRIYQVRDMLTCFPKSAIKADHRRCIATRTGFNPLAGIRRQDAGIIASVEQESGTLQVVHGATEAAAYSARSVSDVVGPRRSAAG